MSWLSVALRGISWRSVLTQGLTLGLPYLYKLIRKKSPTAAEIVERIVEAILQDRPDLHNSPALSAAIRTRILGSALPRELERQALSYAMRKYGENS